MLKWYLHDFVYPKFIGACETLGAIPTTKLAFAMECPDVLPHVGIFRKALRKKITFTYQNGKTSSNGLQTRLGTMRTRVLSVDLVLVDVLFEMHDLIEDEAADGAVVCLALVQRGVHFDVTRQRRVAEKPLAAVAACQRFGVIAAMHGHVLLQI